MAKCPKCERRDLITLTPTGGLISTGLSTLPGQAVKVSARDAFKLACQCGWHVFGYIEGTDFVVPEHARTP